LVCGWLERSCGAGERGGGRAAITQSEAEGWWYAAPLPGGRDLLAFYTDADLPAAADAASVPRLLERAARLPGLPAVRPSPDDRSGYCAAHGVCLQPAAGRDWIAAGDAAVAFDPLSAQGTFNALFTGLAAAEAVH